MDTSCELNKHVIASRIRASVTPTKTAKGAKGAKGLRQTVRSGPTLSGSIKRAVDCYISDSKHTHLLAPAQLPVKDMAGHTDNGRNDVQNTFSNAHTLYDSHHGIFTSVDLKHRLTGAVVVHLMVKETQHGRKLTVRLPRHDDCGWSTLKMDTPTPNPNRGEANDHLWIDAGPDALDIHHLLVDATFARDESTALQLYPSVEKLIEPIFRMACIMTDSVGIFPTTHEERCKLSGCAYRTIIDATTTTTKVRSVSPSAKGTSKNTAIDMSVKAMIARSVPMAQRVKMVFGDEHGPTSVQPIDTADPASPPPPPPPVSPPLPPPSEEDEHTTREQYTLTDWIRNGSDVSN
jgi:hypothetical protein